MDTYFAQLILIGPYGTLALNISKANHLNPSGTVHTARTMLQNRPQKVETLIQTGRLRKRSEKIPNPTVVTSCTAYCVVGMMLTRETE